MLLTSPGLFELENSQGKEFSVTGLMSVVPWVDCEVVLLP
jgi:hypothetical protein